MANAAITLQQEWTMAVVTFLACLLSLSISEHIKQKLNT